MTILLNLKLLAMKTTHSLRGGLLILLILLGSSLSAQSGLQWVSYSGSLPSNVVYGGQENGQKLAICRCNYNGGTHSGKVVGRNCNIGWGGKEIVMSSFEILLNTGAQLSWEAVTSRIPASAVIAGYEGGKPIYVAKGNYNNGVHPGKVFWAGSKYICNIGYGGKEITLNQFKVLTAGQSQASSGQSQASSGPAGFQMVASEGVTKNFTEPVMVAYGANGKYAYKSGVIGSVTFNNATFGDPIPNVPKNGFYKTYSKVASEGQTYQINGVADVAYGANGRFVFKSNVSGSVRFDNGSFGDPAPGVPKYGYVIGTSSTTPSSSTNATSSAGCAQGVGHWAMSGGFMSLKEDGQMTAFKGPKFGTWSCENGKVKIKYDSGESLLLTPNADGTMTGVNYGSTFIVRKMTGQEKEMVKTANQVDDALKKLFKKN